jgi:hypothetical protein
MAKLKGSQFKFRRNQTIGAEGAEQDSAYLEECFYDRGDLETLSDCTKPNCVIVGRTGAGKTALLLRLGEVENHVNQIDPESLSLQYLSGSTILRHLESLGVNLSLFYKLLWRHVFAVELIKARYGMRTETETTTFLQNILNLVKKSKPKENAINYLVNWGRSFWQDTEYRIKEVTAKLETEVKSSLGAKLAPLLEASASGGEKLTVEQKGEMIKHAQEAVNSIQLKDLANVIKLLADEIFHTPQPRYFLVIDRLDEDWVEDALRYRLIKALIETVKEFNHALKSAKIIVAIRRDLLDRVVQETRDAGFQEEKYQPLYLNLRWTQEQLFEMLDRRLNKLVKDQYTQAQVGWTDLMPNKVNKQSTKDYLIERTMYRPRDLLVFFNFCMELAVDKPEITAKMILQAEGEYSQRRLRSLSDEWGVDYPELNDCVEILKKRPVRFPLSDIGDDAVSDLCLALATKVGGKQRGITLWAKEVAEAWMQPREFRSRLAAVFYKVGLIGLKLEPSLSVTWSFLHSPVLLPAQIEEDSTVVICPMFYRVLGINPTTQATQSIT